MPPQSPQRFLGIRGARVCRKEADTGKPQTTIRETVSASYGSWRRVLAQDLGAGSWSQASRTARLPPWLASDAGLPYQIGGPTTEAAKRLPPGLGDDAATHDVAERSDTPRLSR